MSNILEARFYSSGRPKKQMVNITFKDGSGQSGLFDALLPVLREWLEAGNSILPQLPKGFPNHLNRLAYQDHEKFKQPASEVKLWRYMAFDQLVSLLAKRKLWFSRAVALQDADPYEGTLPDLNVRRSAVDLALEMPMLNELPQEKLEQFVASHRSFQKISNLNLVSCFNVAEHESNAMWHVYGKGVNCVALTTTFAELKECFGPFVDYDVFIGQIEYIDYSKAFLDESNYLLPLLHKAPFYSYENEVRCLIVDDGDNNLFDDHEPSPFDELLGKSSRPYSPGAYVPVDLSKLLKEIVIGPRADKWFIETVQDVLQKYEVEVQAKPSILRK
jgi:hypothetical protein